MCAVVCQRRKGTAASVRAACARAANCYSASSCLCPRYTRRCLRRVQLQVLRRALLKVPRLQADGSWIARRRCTRSSDCGTAMCLRRRSILLWRGARRGDRVVRDQQNSHACGLEARVATSHRSREPAQPGRTLPISFEAAVCGATQSCVLYCQRVAGVHVAEAVRCSALSAVFVHPRTRTAYQRFFCCVLV